VLLFGLKVPVPPLQIAPVATVTAPFKMIALLFAHTVPFAPAFTVGAGVKVITRLSETWLQVPLPVLVKVSVKCACGDLGSGGCVGRVQRRVVRAEAAQSTAPYTPPLQRSRCR
jgi:hypothetical protein